MIFDGATAAASSSFTSFAAPIRATAALNAGGTIGSTMLSLQRDPASCVAR